MRIMRFNTFKTMFYIIEASSFSVYRFSKLSSWGIRKIPEGIIYINLGHWTIEID